MNPAPDAAQFNAPDRTLQTVGYVYPPSGLKEYIGAPTTTEWYSTKWGCLTQDPTQIVRAHTFPDVVLPRRTLTPAPDVRICGLTYANAWPAEQRDSDALVETEMNHPQFAFQPGGPATPYQIDVESQLRRLDQPLSRCQAIIPEDAPLHRNTVAPPMPVGVPQNVQNAGNPIAVIVRPGGEGCRQAADAVASAMSGRWIGNPTRQDTMRMDLPFGPPGVGSGAARGPTAPVQSEPYFTNAPQRLARAPVQPVPPFQRQVVYGA